MKKVTEYYTLFDNVTKTARPLVPAENCETILRELKTLINENKLQYFKDLDLYLVLEFIEEDGKFKINEVNKKVMSLFVFDENIKDNKKNNKKG